MMNRVAMRLLADVAWGAKFRLYTGAALSIMDMVTDVMTIIRFFDEGNNHFALANIAFIISNLVLQLIMVFVQNKKRGTKVVAYEMLIVAIMIKPAIDAMRVANGDAQADNTALILKPNLLSREVLKCLLNRFLRAFFRCMPFLGVIM